MQEVVGIAVPEATGKIMSRPFGAAVAAIALGKPQQRGSSEPPLGTESQLRNR